jgi:enoyl-CoA hydratase/carnithine racemase
MTGPLVLLEHLGDGVSRIALNRPDRMNSLTPELFDALADAVRTVERDGTRALVLTGAGERAFCAGYDLAMLPSLPAMTVPEFLDLEDRASGAVAALHRLPFPVVAAIRGAASGGGLSLALAADLRLAAPDAKLNAAFVRVGLSVGELGTSWLLTRLVGPGMAAELAFTGRIVAAEEALAIGLVNRVVAGDALADEAVALARELAAPGRLDAVGARIGKRTLRARGEQPSFAAALDIELGDRP